MLCKEKRNEKNDRREMRGERGNGRKIKRNQNKS